MKNTPYAAPLQSLIQLIYEGQTFVPNEQFTKKIETLMKLLKLKTPISNSNKNKRPAQSLLSQSNKKAKTVHNEIDATDHTASHKLPRPVVKTKTCEICGKDISNYPQHLTIHYQNEIMETLKLFAAQEKSYCVICIKQGAKIPFANKLQKLFHYSIIHKFLRPYLNTKLGNEILGSEHVNLKSIIDTLKGTLESSVKESTRDPLNTTEKSGSNSISPGSKEDKKFTCTICGIKKCEDLKSMKIHLYYHHKDKVWPEILKHIEINTLDNCTKCGVTGFGGNPWKMTNVLNHYLDKHEEVLRQYLTPEMDHYVFEQQ